MILVDTSVLIDFLKGAKNQSTALLEDAIKQNLPFGIACYTYQEVLQGAKNKREYEQLEAYLSTQRIYYLPENEQSYENAARIFFEARRKGITVRSTVDVLIVCVALEYDLFLLHNDRDFEMLAGMMPELKVYR